MQESKLALYISTIDDGSTVYEELILRAGHWFHVSGSVGGGRSETPMSYQEARAFAICNVKENNSFLVPDRIPELEFLLRFEWPILLHIEGFEDPWDFDPSAWTLIAFLKDSKSPHPERDLDYFETQDEFLFSSEELFLRVLFCRSIIDCDHYVTVTGHILEPKDAARLLGLNGIDLPDALKPYETVKKLTPDALARHLALKNTAATKSIPANDCLLDPPLATSKPSNVDKVQSAVGDTVSIHDNNVTPAGRIDSSDDWMRRYNAEYERLPPLNSIPEPDRLAEYERREAILQALYKLPGAPQKSSRSNDETAYEDSKATLIAMWIAKPWTEQDQTLFHSWWRIHAFAEEKRPEFLDSDLNRRAKNLVLLAPKVQDPGGKEAVGSEGLLETHGSNATDDRSVGQIAANKERTTSTVEAQVSDKAKEKPKQEPRNRESLAMEIHSQLKGQSAKLFQFLLSRAHYVSFDTLRESFDSESAVFTKSDPTDDAIRQAIKRLNACLYASPFSCAIDGKRVKLEYLDLAKGPTSQDTSTDK